MLRHTGNPLFEIPNFKFAIHFTCHALLLPFFLLASVSAPASAQEKPKVRTITAFVRLDPADYKQQFADTLSMLRNAKARYELAGYQVQTIRIATQPFP